MYASHSQLLPSVVIFASLGIVQASLTLPSLIAKIPNSLPPPKDTKKESRDTPDSPFLNFCNKREQRSSLQLPSIAKIMSAANNPHSTKVCSPTPTTHSFLPSPSSRAQKYPALSSYQSYTPTHSTAYQDKAGQSDEYHL